METGKTYIIYCRQGRRKDECPMILQRGLHCVECPAVGYFLREKFSQNEENEESEETDVNHES